MTSKSLNFYWRIRTRVFKIGRVLLGDRIPIALRNGFRISSVSIFEYSFQVQYKIQTDCSRSRSVDRVRCRTGGQRFDSRLGIRSSGADVRVRDPVIG